MGTCCVAVFWKIEAQTEPSQCRMFYGGLERVVERVVERVSIKLCVLSRVCKC